MSNLFGCLLKTKRLDKRRKTKDSDKRRKAKIKTKDSGKRRKNKKKQKLLTKGRDPDARSFMVKVKSNFLF